MEYLSYLHLLPSEQTLETETTATASTTQIAAHNQWNEDSEHDSLEMLEAVIEADCDRANSSISSIEMYPTIYF